jgi:predicted permease
MFALGRLGLDQSVLIFLASVVLTFVVAPAVYGAEGGVRGTVRAVLRLPAIWAMGVALLVRNLGLPVPVGIGRGIELLSQATLPVLLLALGVQLGASRGLTITRAIATAVLGRIVVIPVLAVGLGWAIGLPALPLQALVLASAMPTAVNAFILAQEYEADVETVAGAVTLSTFVSFGTVAIVTALLPAVGTLAR